MSSVSVEVVSGSNSQMPGAGVALRNAEHDDLSLLALDTAMAELDMALETVSTMVFELQVSSVETLTLLVHFDLLKPAGTASRCRHPKGYGGRCGRPSGFPTVEMADCAREFTEALAHDRCGYCSGGNALASWPFCRSDRSSAIRKDEAASGVAARRSG